MDIFNIKLSKKQEEYSDEAIFALVKRILKKEGEKYEKKEHLWIVVLDKNKKIILINLTLIGDKEKIIDIKAYDIFASAIAKNGSYIVIVHNHPGTVSTPSRSDITFTNHFYQIGVLLGIQVLDHIIISGLKYSSFIKLGYMKKFESNLKSIKSYETQEEINNLITKAKEDGYYKGFKEGIIKGKKSAKKESRRKDIESGIKRGKILGIKHGIKEGFAKGYGEGVKSGIMETAGRMYKNNMSNFDIIRFTGISKKELDNIVQNKNPNNY